MIAIEIREPGEPEVLVPVERPLPAPAADEVLIRVAAAGVNRPDVFQRRGRYAPPPGASRVDCAQGYLLSRPLSAKAARELLLSMAPAPAVTA